MKMNLPNKLTVMRIILVPVCMFFIVITFIPDTWARIISAAVFILTALTDMLDGMIARKKNLITNFGKFLDPIADKLLIIGSLMAIGVRYREDLLFEIFLLCALFVIIAREIAVTSLRMIASSGGNVVIAANIWGKLKTVSQTVCVLVILLEPVIIPGYHNIASYVMLVLTTAMTVFSGITYFKAYKNFLNPEQ